MAYELFERSGVRVESTSVSVATDGRMIFNAAAVRVLLEKGVRFALLLWDKSTSKVAIKATNKGNKNAYAISIVPKHSGSLRAKAFLLHIGWSATKREMLPATWNEQDRMFEIAIPSRYLVAVREATPKRKFRWADKDGEAKV